MQMRLLKKSLCLLLIGLCAIPLSGYAASDIYEGSVTAPVQTAICSPCDAIISSIDVVNGQTITDGTQLLAFRTERVFAACDGSVASSEICAGRYVDGRALCVAPVSRYEIICSVRDAYKRPENMFPHMGQGVYVKCRKDGTHRAKAIVTKIDGERYTLAAVGGELYVGEAVYIYPSDSFERRECMGAGTVLQAAPIEYSATGCITRVYVEPGDMVERGQILYEYLAGTDLEGKLSPEFKSRGSGIITSISAKAGMPVKKDAVLFTFSDPSALRISIAVSENDAWRIHAGDAAEIILPWLEREDALMGRVESVSEIGQAKPAPPSPQSSAAPLPALGRASADAECMYEVIIAPSDAQLIKLGMNVDVIFPELH